VFETVAGARDALTPAGRRLVAARFWRSIAQGVLVADLALYLHALQWSGVEIGSVLSGAGLAGAAFSLAVGLTSDRYRRKPFLLAYEGLCTLCALVALSTTRTLPLAAAIVLAGFGRGANGSAGPFAPAEQAWLAETAEPHMRGFVFSLNAAMGFTGMALGALAGVLPTLWQGLLGGAQSYRPLFVIVILGNAANLVLLWGAQETRRKRAVATAAAAAQSVDAESLARKRQRENTFLRRLVALNALNGMATGLTGPLMAYWFAVRFDVGPAAIAPVMALAFLVTAAASLASGSLTRRSGLVNVVVWGRGAGLALLTILPLVPVYALAALLYILRSALSRGTAGARQALVVSAVRNERRGFAASVNALSGQVPQSVGPAMAGGLIGAGWFAAPFYAAAALQLAYLLFYRRAFRSFEKEILRRK
jgi:MFS family permease